MINRRDIRYGNFWVRLLCCLWVAVAVANAIHFDLFGAWEDVARRVLIGGGEDLYRCVTGSMETVVLFSVCAAASILRIERPLAMVGCGVLLAAVYTFVVLIVAFNLGIALPIASALVGVVGSTGVLETMAWSEERSRRRALEKIEAAKQQFTDMLVHDLRRRIGSILMSFTMLEERTDRKDGKTRELMDTIRVTAERVLIEVSDLLDIRKIEEGKMSLQREEVSLRGILEDCMKEHSPVRDLLGVDIQLKGEGDLVVDVDPAIFSRVVANLFWNAMQHAPPGTGIEVLCGCGTEGWAGFSVANRGKIIPVDKQDEVFESFVSGRVTSQPAAFPATGLGLAFCKLALEAHGCQILLESPWRDHGDGVKFTVDLPDAIVMHP